MKKLILLSVLMGAFTVAHAQTTGTELKTQIDTDITNKTGAGSITKAAVGGNMKDIVDYVDQQDLELASILGAKANLNSPQFTGNVRSVTPTLGDNSTKVATTDFVNGSIAAFQSSLPLPILEWSAQVSQAGTGAPIPQISAVNTIEGGSFGDGLYRELIWARTGVGTYTVKLYYTSGNLDTSKVAIYTPYNVKITAKTDSSDGGGAFRQYTFQSLDETGTPDDDLLTGNNGGYFNIKIYQ